LWSGRRSERNHASRAIVLDVPLRCYRLFNDHVPLERPPFSLEYLVFSIQTKTDRKARSTSPIT
jgi:hypothetical protein